MRMRSDGQQPERRAHVPLAVASELLKCREGYNCLCIHVNKSFIVRAGND